MALNLSRAYAGRAGCGPVFRSASVVYRRAVALARLCLLCAAAAGAAEPAESPAVDPVAIARAFKVYRTPSGRFGVVSPHSGENLIVGKWADNVLARFEGQTGLRCAASRARPITITISPAEKDAEAGVEVDVRGRRLTVRKPFEMDRELVDVVLCGCLFDSCILGYLEERQGDVGGAAEEANPPLPPAWLVTGLARSLHAELRAHDAAAACTLWRRAALPTVAACLSGDEGVADAAMRSCRGFFVASFLRHADGKAMMADAVASVAQGHPLDLQWLLGVSEWRVAADVEEWWDAMILRQTRVVRHPGQMTEEDRQRFEAALLLYPGAFGMPLSHALYEPVSWAELIDVRKEPWIEEFCRCKELSLRMLAAGRGDLLQATAEAYAGFLQYLAQGKSEKRLRRKLAEAEASLSVLRSAPME